MTTQTPEPFVINEKNEYWDPFSRAWKDAHVGQAYVDFVKQAYANQLAGQGGGWSIQTGWDGGGKAAMPTDWNAAYDDYWNQTNRDKYSGGFTPSGAQDASRYYDGSYRNPSVVGGYQGQQTPPSSIVGLSGVTRQVDSMGRILGDNGQQMSDAGGLLSWSPDGMYSGGKLAYGIQNGRVTPLQPNNPAVGNAPPPVLLNMQPQQPGQQQSPQPQQGLLSPNNFFKSYWGK